MHDLESGEFIFFFFFLRFTLICVSSYLLSVLENTPVSFISRLRKIMLMVI